MYAYALMGNHYHLLIETPEPNLVDGMRWFQGVYTQRFKGRHKEWGHLFQGRYKALLVDQTVMQKKVAEVVYSEDPAMADEAWAEIRKGWVFGSDEFCAEMKMALKLIRRNTSVRNEWISNALNMGNVSTVSRGVHSVEASKDDRLFDLKQIMSKIKDPFASPA